jgi:hypothetical protein
MRTHDVFSKDPSRKLVSGFATRYERPDSHVGSVGSVG